MEIEEVVGEQEEEQQYEQLRPYQLTRHYQRQSATFEREFDHWIKKRYNHYRQIFEDEHEQLYNDFMYI